jgi:hypothetical protein
MNNIPKSNTNFDLLFNCNWLAILYSKTPVFSFNYPNSIAKSRRFSFNL